MLNASAQPAKVVLQGYVIDETTRSPLSGATVRTSIQQVVSSSMTDKFGYFEIRVQRGNLSLAVSFMGYREISLDISTQDTTRTVFQLGKISLSAQPSQLNEVTIKGTKNLLKFKDEVLVYDLKSDTANNKGTLSIAMKEMPFIDVDVNGNISYKSAKRILVLINGKINSGAQQNLSQTLRAYPASTIDRVEMADPAPYRYQMMGYDAVFDIVTKDHIVGTSVSFNLSQNSRKGYDRNVYGYLNKKKFGLSVNLSQARTRLNETNQTLFQQDQSAVQQQNFTNDYRQDRYLAELGTNFQSTQGLFSFNNSLVLLRDRTSQFENQLNLYRNLENSIANELSWQNANRSKNQWFIGTKNVYNTTKQANTGLSDQSNTEHNNEFSLQADYTRLFKGKLPSKVDGGLKYINRDNELSPFSRVQGLSFAQHILIPYASASWKFEKNYSLTTGLRLEATDLTAAYPSATGSFQRTDLALLPQLTFSKTMLRSRTLSLQIRSRTLRPGIAFLNPYPNVLNPAYIIRGNPQLRPQNTYTLALSYSKYTTKLNVSVEYYKSLVTGSITELTYLNPLTQGQELTFTNSGRNTFDGIYVYLSGKLLPKLRFNSTSSIGYVGITNQSIRNDGVFWNLNCSLDYRFTSGYTLQGLSNFSSNTVLLQGEETGTRLMTLAVSKQLFKGNGALNLSISDPFLTRRTFLTQIDDGQLSRSIAVSRQARLINLAVYYKFGKLKEEKMVSPKKVRSDDVKTKETL